MAMLHKTQGIVLNYVRYRDTSIIVKIYTSAFGLQTYIVNGARGSSSGAGKAKAGKIAFFQHLTLLELVVYKKPHADINRISEIKCIHPFQHIPFAIQKSCIAIFLTEILSKTLKEETGDPGLFEFLSHSVRVLDHLEERYENFHIQFLLKLSRYLGFAPQSAHEMFEQLHYLANNEALAKKEKQALDALIPASYGQYIQLSARIRRDLLEKMVQFYKLHTGFSGDVKSMQILREVMH